MIRPPEFNGYIMKYKIIITFLCLTFFTLAAQANECVDLMQKEDFYEAANVCTALAKEDDKNAQFSLGLMFYQGNGMMSDLSQAQKWWRKAAQNNHSDAQFNLGIMLANGQGGSSDLVAAYAWLKIAAENGSLAAKDSAKQMAEELSSGEKKQADEKLELLKKEYEL
jgi:TPR repeat protein